MKNKLFILLLACGVSLLSACGGDHPTSQGLDTEANRYNAKDSAVIDTSKVISNDNSASGGVTAMKKDTSMKKDTGTKK